MLFERHHCWQAERRTCRSQPNIRRKSIFDLRQIESEIPELNRGGGFRGRRPQFELGHVPIRKKPLALFADLIPRFVQARETCLPLLAQCFPTTVMFGTRCVNTIGVLSTIRGGSLVSVFRKLRKSRGVF